MTTIDLDQYYDSLESLPVEVRRNFKLMRDLDSRAQLIMQDIDRLGGEFLQIASELSQEQRKEHVAKIHKLFDKVKGYGDDKVQIALQTYALIDKHIRRLDFDLARFESEMKIGSGNESSTPQPDPAPTAPNKSGRKREKQSKKQKTGTDDKNSKGASASPAGKSEIVIEAEQVASNGAAGADLLDMPVDPNEPTYCVCDEVSHGKMIACDNLECPIEWFHIGCMDLSSIPKKKWYCPTCQSARKINQKQKTGTHDKNSKGASKKHQSEIVIAAEQVASSGAAGADVLDMPVDPTEPTYCVCDEVSYGKMIACDNPECPIEWFHIGCMNLSSIPKGKWYCPTCQGSTSREEIIMA